MWDKRVRLTLRWMFETAVGNGAQKLSLEQEITETGRVDTNVAALLVGAASGHGEITLFVGVAVGGSSGGSGGWRSRGLQLLIRVIDQIFFVGHVEGVGRALKVRVGLRVATSWEVVS